MVENKPFVPEVLYNGEYYPICGHNFWDNKNGATIICKFFGFNTAQVTRTHDTFDAHSMFLGRCTSDDNDLTKCTGGGNEWGDLEAREGSCKKGNGVGFKVTCNDPGMSG